MSSEKRLMSLISSEGKSKDELTEEVWQAHLKAQAAQREADRQALQRRR